MEDVAVRAKGSKCCGISTRQSYSERHFWKDGEGRYKSLHIQIIGLSNGFRDFFFPFPDFGGGPPAFSSA